jgi:two-component system cell cycle response regulator
METIAARVVLVEKNDDVRAQLMYGLREAGFEVRGVPDAAFAAEVAIMTQPDVVVTSVWLAGMSGLQLCRVLRAEPSTAHIPVVMMGDDNDRRSRFLAEHAGAVGFVAKDRTADLVKVLLELTQGGAMLAPRAPRNRGPASRIEDRLAELLDDALSNSVVSSEVRSLANAGSFAGLFTGLALLVNQLTAYRWLALAEPSGRIGIHTHPSTRRMAESEARVALGADEATNVFFVDETRASEANAVPRTRVTPLHETISFGGVRLGELAMSPEDDAPADASSMQGRLFSLIVSELGGPMRMATLVEDARRLAATDGLTGLMNRRAFSEALSREISSATRHAHPLSVIVLDIDHFKTINDTRGHNGGDAVLRALGRLLGTETRRSDLTGRWGGEEFVMALTHTNAAGARVVGDRLCQRISQLEIRIADAPIPITASLGIATLNAGETLDDLIARADHAMYEAKNAGRNRVQAA